MRHRHGATRYESALDLVMRGVGDTIVCKAVVDSTACPPGLLTASFAAPLYDTIALVQGENAVFSPATREFARLAQRTLTGRRTPATSVGRRRKSQVQPVSG